jgi:tetratricopeptide (TPR) repeat protein
MIAKITAWNKILFILILLKTLTSITVMCQVDITWPEGVSQKEFDFFVKGNANFELQNFSEAMNYYNSALELNPKFERALSSRSTLKYELKDYRGSISDCNKILAINTDESMRLHSYTYYLRGSCNHQLGRHYEAIDDLNRAASTYSNLEKAEKSYVHYMRGGSLISIGKIEEGCLDLSISGELGFYEAYEVISKYCR